MWDFSARRHPQRRGALTRRDFMRYAWWAALGLLVAEGAAATGLYLWPQIKPGAFGSGKVTLGSVDRLGPVGSMTYFPEQRLYLSRLPTGLLALYRRCTHLGCVVPWLPDERSEDSLAQKGRFNCPCHGSIFDRYGVVRAGPAPRPLDTFPVEIVEGKMVVDTGKILQRATFNETQVTPL